MYGPHVKQITVIAAVIAAILYLNSTVFKPVYESGPLPIPSRAEVDELRRDTTMSLDNVKKGLDTTVETAKTALATAQQAVQEGKDNRVRRLLQLKIDLEAALKTKPDDKLLQTQLAQTTLDLASAQAQAQPSAQQQTAPPK